MYIYIYKTEIHLAIGYLATTHNEQDGKEGKY